MAHRHSSCPSVNCSLNWLLPILVLCLDQIPGRRFNQDKENSGRLVASSLFRCTIRRWLEGNGRRSEGNGRLLEGDFIAFSAPMRQFVQCDMIHSGIAHKPMSYVAALDFIRS